jgi:hypothetical protein
MDDAGLLHLASHMPQLLHMDVSSCSNITLGGLSKAREAATGCASHCKIIFRLPSYYYDDSE